MHTQLRRRSDWEREREAEGGRRGGHGRNGKKGGVKNRERRRGVNGVNRGGEGGRKRERGDKTKNGLRSFEWDPIVLQPATPLPSSFFFVEGALVVAPHIRVPETLG